MRSKTCTDHIRTAGLFVHGEPCPAPRNVPFWLAGTRFSIVRVSRRLECSKGGLAMKSLTCAAVVGLAVFSNYAFAQAPMGHGSANMSEPDSACSLWAWTCCAEHFHSVARLKRRRKDRLSCVSPRAVRPAGRYRGRLETKTYPA